MAGNRTCNLQTCKANFYYAVLRECLYDVVLQFNGLSVYYTGGLYQNAD